MALDLELYAFGILGGYNLDCHTKISSQGYCDDTVILAEDIRTIQIMSNHTAAFFKKHELTLNQTKTYFIGRTEQGMTNTIPVTWPGLASAIMPRDHSLPFRYLGLHINMDLNWDHQIGIMNGKIMGLVSHLKHRRITLAQGSILIRLALNKQLEIGFRHATIPMATLENWDKWIKDALTCRADVPLGRLHVASVRLILSTLTFENEYILDKTIHLMETLTRESITQFFCQTRFNTATQQSVEKKRKNKLNDPWSEAIILLARHKIIIMPNNKAINKLDEEVLACFTPDTTLTFEGKQVPICTSSNYALWGADFKPEPNTLAIICTDGSTDPRKPTIPSGASLVFADDKLKRQEYSNIHHTWKLMQANNYIAEMAAINKSIRSIPVTVPLLIPSDSKSSIEAITAYTRTNSSTPPLRCTARPYLISISRAIAIRALHGASTSLEQTFRYGGGDRSTEIISVESN